MKRSHARSWPADELLFGWRQRPFCCGGIPWRNPYRSRPRELPNANDRFDDAFAELLRNEPPGNKGLVLAY